MKTLYKTLLVIVIVFMSACSEDFLDKTPLVVASVENYYTTESEANTAIIGIYSVGQEEGFAMVQLLLLGDICSDDCDMANQYSDAYWWMGSGLQPLMKFEGLSGNWVSGAPWAPGFRAINWATMAIEKISVNENIPEAKRNQFVGEAHFLRAFHYFFLVRTYGRMPIIDHVLTYDEYYNPRATIEETWEFIESDLIAASQKLPAKNQYSGADLGRASKGAADALLGQVYMYQGKFQQAYDVLKTVETSGLYGLEPVYADVFSLAKENGIESIFEVQHNTTKTGWGNANEGNMLGFYVHDADPSDPVRWHRGWAMQCPTQDLVNSYEPDDPRLNASIIVKNEFFDGRINQNYASSTGYLSKKWYVPFDQRNPSDASDNPKNTIHLRFASVLLYLAEAANELNKTGEALAYLEQVRSRARDDAGGGPDVLPQITESNKDALRDIIWHERRVEMALEGQRFYDLVRQKRAGNVMRAYSTTYSSYKGQSFIDGKSELFPIPQSQIDASRGTLEQNPGY